MFNPLPEKISYPELEENILDFWETSGVFQQSLEQRERENAPWFNFYEGPPTANGAPGIHHVMARTLKDLVCRYKTMRGYYVRRQAGWDTHGLPVEIAVSKQLNLVTRDDIAAYGIDRYNKACRDLVNHHITMQGGWRTLTRRMGYWVDMDSAYITCTNDYIESVWWALKQYFDKGLIYKGFKVVPQSPTIETPLSSHELSLGYKEVRDPNVYLRLRITESPRTELNGASILVWTTTPWTLFANVALAVGENIEYAHVRVTTQHDGNEQINHYVLATSRLSILDGTVEVLSTFNGKEILGSRYEAIFPDVEFAVRMNNVSISYNGKQILDKIDWKVRKGERWSISGHNGAGKSTLVSLITADNPQAFANEIFIFDKKKGSGESIWDIKRNIGFVSPEMHLYFDKSFTAFETIASGLFDTIGLFRKLNSEQVDLITTWMKGLDIEHIKDRYLHQLSLGQQRIVMLARALVKCPPLLILDEPCQGLDNEQVNFFKQLIDVIADETDMTLIYISHFNEDIPSCVSKQLHLENGMINHQKSTL
ncbi:MAG: ATP-binding cassette domain-containing protein [Chitinophagia bacterium]|nr:ATP-binding cassette domain-containing protein [Chitinophagia bacterium]